MGKPKVQKVYTTEEFIPKGGFVCGFFWNRPFYVEECDARLFQMYPSTPVQETFCNEKSRIAIHMGEHLHPPWSTPSCDSIKKAEKVIKRKVVASPQANTCLIKDNVICELRAMMEQDLVVDLTEEIVDKMWESLFCCFHSKIVCKAFVEC